MLNTGAITHWMAAWIRHRGDEAVALPVPGARGDFAGITGIWETQAGRLEADARRAAATALPLTVPIARTCSTCHTGYRKENQ